MRLPPFFVSRGEKGGKEERGIGVLYCFQLYRAHQAIIKGGKNGGERMEVFVNLSYIVITMISKHFVIVCPFFFLYHIFTFRSFCNTVRFSFESRKSRERERYFFILETLVEIVIRGKLARRDKLGLCFKCRERRGTKRK